MVRKDKLSEIDLQIKALQEKKKKLEEKQLIQLAQLIKKSGAHSFASEVLVGVMIEAVKTSKENQDSVKRWQQIGADFLTAEKEKTVSKNKNDKINENEAAKDEGNKKAKESHKK